MQKNKMKVCYTFSGKVFLAAAKSSQRGESVFAILKENGDRNREMARFSLYRLAIHIGGHIKRMNGQSLTEIKTLIQKKKLWSNSDQMRWESELSLVAQYRVDSTDRIVYQVAHKTTHMGPTSMALTATTGQIKRFLSQHNIPVRSVEFIKPNFSQVPSFL